MPLISDALAFIACFYPFSSAITISGKYIKKHDVPTASIVCLYEYKLHCSNMHTICCILYKYSFIIPVPYSFFSGGFGFVYSGENILTNEPCAIKVIFCCVFCFLVGAMAMMVIMG